MKILSIGDTIGKTGRKALSQFLPFVIKQYKPDFITLNVENIAGGFGVTKKVLNSLKQYSIDVFTSGNHIFDKKEVYELLDTEENLLRPANYPPLANGRGYTVVEKENKKIAVINLMGRVFMGIPLDCPFRKFDEIYNQIKDKVDYIIVDFHAEATSEKTAFGYYVDGRASIVFGTHSHVQTADEIFLPKGTAYITDIGLTGALHSVIGMKIEEPIEKFLTGLPKKYEVATGELLFQAFFVDLQKKEIKRLRLTESHLR
ncbi:MAG: TIGR00282 family metallophosphoesterase [Aquificae bacterium]|nr:TIGR00282 family metallophosphoesterase [Aquificota bacterium]